jgi:DivIVA domain-containing protein
MEEPMSTEPSLLAEIPHKQFTVVLRGYDRDEVDQFLAQIEEAVQELMDRVGSRPAPGQIAEWLGREVEAVLAAAEAAAVKVRTDSDAAAETTRQQAESDVVKARGKAESASADAARVRDAAEEEASEIRLKAQEEAERILREARLVAERIENAAEGQRRQILEDAEERRQALEEREREIHARIAALEETFGALRGMVSDQDRGRGESAPDEDLPTEENRVVDLKAAEGETRKNSS